MTYRIVVDSSSDIPLDLAKSHQIIVVPMPVSIGKNTYLEGVELTPEQFYEQFRAFESLPKTSTPNPSLLLKAYEEILENDHEVVAIHLSSGLSSTVATAEMVRNMCTKPDKVHIIDSLGASFGYGLLVLSISDKLSSFDSWSSLEHEILNIIKRMRYIFTLDTLEYLVQGGRVSKTAGLVGGLLDIKPILHINSEGRIEPFAKIRSRRASIRKLVEIMKNEISNSHEQIIGISHSDCIDDANFLANEIRTQLEVKDILISSIGCVVGSHTGPGTIALFYQK